MPKRRADTLTRLATEIFTAAGAPREHARSVAEHLVEANLAGHDSHGVLRVPQYIAQIDAGRLKPAARSRVVCEAPASAVIEGGDGFGQVIAQDAMRLAIAKARAGGVGAVAVRQVGHTGRLGTYTQMAAREGLVGIVAVNSAGGGQAVAPFGGTGRRLATNPISIGAPSNGPFPLVLDIASSVAPEGKVRNHYQSGKSVPPGWLIDARGEPTTDPADFYADPPGALLPMGGAVAHKGSGLSFMIDILAGALSGAGCVRPDPTEGRDGMLAIALDVAHFGPLAEFVERIAVSSAHVKSSPMAPGFERIYLPGEMEAMQRERRLRDGIEIQPAVWEQIEKICQRFAIDPSRMEDAR